MARRPSAGRDSHARAVASRDHRWRGGARRSRVRSESAIRGGGRVAAAAEKCRGPGSPTGHAGPPSRLHQVLAARQGPAPAGPAGGGAPVPRPVTCPPAARRRCRSGSPSRPAWRGVRAVELDVPGGLGAEPAGPRTTTCRRSATRPGTGGAGRRRAARAPLPGRPDHRRGRPGWRTRRRRRRRGPPDPALAAARRAAARAGGRAGGGDGRADDHLTGALELPPGGPGEITVRLANNRLPAARRGAADLAARQLAAVGRWPAASPRPGRRGTTAIGRAPRPPRLAVVGAGESYVLRPASLQRASVVNRYHPPAWIGQ